MADVHIAGHLPACALCSDDGPGVWVHAETWDVTGRMHQACFDAWLGYLNGTLDLGQARREASDARWAAIVRRMIEGEI